MLFRGFVCLKHCSYPSELFNLKPQSLGLGLISQSAYIFSDNVVLEALRLVNQSLFFTSSHLFRWGLLTYHHPFLYFFVFIITYLMLFVNNFFPKSVTTTKNFAITQVCHNINLSTICYFCI